MLRHFSFLCITCIIMNLDCCLRRRL